MLLCFCALKNSPLKGISPYILDDYSTYKYCKFNELKQRLKKIKV